jgi:hypothetical protein
MASRSLLGGLTYAGWGMRVTFVSDDRTIQTPLAEARPDRWPTCPRVALTEPTQASACGPILRQHGGLLPASPMATTPVGRVAAYDRRDVLRIA